MAKYVNFTVLRGTAESEKEGLTHQIYDPK
jgi:hypothetical protein